jgi:outer membrane lipoprotein-sorting protein
VRTVVAMILLSLAVGCSRRENIPTYPNMRVAESLEIIRARSNGVRDVAGEGTITLTDPNGRSVRLDAAFVLAPPDRARVRAWKFGQAVLDLTMVRHETWVFSQRSDEGADRLRSSIADAQIALREWVRMLSSSFDEHGTARELGAEISVTSHAKLGGSMIAFIDRRTLTPRQYVLRDENDREHFTLTLDRYRAIGDGNVVWPMRIKAKSRTGTIRIDLRDVELNVAPPNAFKPPARAGRLP